LPVEDWQKVTGLALSGIQAPGLKAGEAEEMDQSEVFFGDGVADPAGGKRNARIP
jgi:hypothetical protein